MSKENLQTMIMQNVWWVKEVYYGIVQVVNDVCLTPFCILRIFTMQCGGVTNEQCAVWGN